MKIVVSSIIALTTLGSLPQSVIASPNLLASVPADTQHSHCVSYNSHALATDGGLNNRVTGGNCGATQDLVFDLGSAQEASKFSYVYCSVPGFTNGAVKDFTLAAGDTIDGTYDEVFSASLPEGASTDVGKELSFTFPEKTARFWKFSALNNHGNGSYIWTCELKLEQESTSALENIAANTQHSQCVSYNSHAAATDGLTNNRVTGSNCGTVQTLVYDLGTTQEISELKYISCSNPGFSNGAVKDFSLSVGDAIDGSYEDIISSMIPENTGNTQGEEFSFTFPAKTGRYWKFTAMNNHGNGSYIWTCELELY